MIIACMSPTDTNYEETLSTLKYACSAKFINNKSIINDRMDPKDEIIMELRNEIKILRRQLYS